MTPRTARSPRRRSWKPRFRSRGVTPLRRSHSPTRTCAGCGRKAPQSELVRFGAVAGELTPGRTLPGRGVYTCRRLPCFERALANRGFNRVLRRNLTVDPELGRLYTRSSMTEAPHAE